MARGDDVSFDVRAPLGVGGFGEVSLALMKKDGDAQYVALKRIRADLLEQQDYLMQFEREAKICAHLDHPHVVKQVAFGHDDDGPYLALEYVNGRPASAIDAEYERRGEAMPLAVALAISRDAARGLSYAHGLVVGADRGLIHRDLSPDNILVAYDGTAKLSDFGIARAMGQTRMTTQGGVKGKLGYMSPQILDGEDADVRSDLFAFAATMYRLLCGQHAFDGKTEAELIRNVLKCKPARLDGLCDVPADVNEWVMACLQKRPQARPESVRPVLKMLEAHCQSRPDEGRGDVKACMRALWPTQAGVSVQQLAAQATALKQARPTAKSPVRFVLAAALLVLTLAATATALLFSGADPTLARPPQRPLQAEQADGPNPLNAVDVEVRSEPKGAIVQLDGIKQASRTPMTLKGLRPGQLYQVDVAAPGFYAWSEKVVADGKAVDVKLKPLAVQK
jgi:eukaryotic-like serine/threonine-protein kinase